MVYVTIASLAYAISGFLVKQISQSVSYNVIVFFRFAIGLLWLVPLIIKDKSILQAKNYKLHCLRGLCGLLALASFFYAIKFIPLVDAMLLNNVTPLFIPLILVLFLNQKTTPKLVASIVIGFIGVFLVLSPGKEIFKWASLIALSSSIFAAIASISIKDLSKNNSTNTILCYYFIIATLGSGITLPFSFKLTSYGAFIILIIIGTLGIIFQNGVTKAFRDAPAQVISPLLYLSIVFGAILDFVFNHHIPSKQVIAGFVLILLGCSLTVLSRNNTANKARKNYGKAC